MERSSVHIAVLVVAEDPATVDLAAATFLSDRVSSAGHRVVAQEIVEASEAAIRDQLSRWISQGHIDAIVAVGAGEPAAAALGPLVTSPLQGLTDQLRLLARDRGGEGKPAAARCAKKFVFLLPAEVPALGPVLNQLVLPQLDSTQPRNLVSEMPRHGAVPQSLPSEKTASGAGLVPKLPAREKRRTGGANANVISRPNRIDDPTKPIELDSLEKQLAQEQSQAARSESHDAVTRPHIDIASMLPPVPPGADVDTAETAALPEDKRAPTWDDVASPPPLTVQPSRLRTGPIAVAKPVGNAVGNNDKTVVRAAPTSRETTAVGPAPAAPREEKTAVRPAPVREEKTTVRAAPTREDKPRPASQTNRGVQATPAIGSQAVRPPAATGSAAARPMQPTPAIGSQAVRPPAATGSASSQPPSATGATARPIQPTPAIGSPAVRPPAATGSASSQPTPATTGSAPARLPSVVAPAAKPAGPTVPAVIPSIPGPSARGAQPTPAAGAPSVRDAQPTPAAGAPSVRGAQPTPAAGAPSVRGAQPTPAAGAPSVRDAQPTPAAGAPSVSSVSPAASAAPATAAPSSAAPVSAAVASAAPSNGTQPAAGAGAQAASRLPMPTPVSGVHTATAASAANVSTPKPADVVDTAAPAAATARAVEPEIDPASSAELIEASAVELIESPESSPQPASPPSPVASSAPPVPPAAARPPRVPARPAIPPETRATAVPVTKLASAGLPSSPQLSQPELFDLSEGVSKKRRSRTGTALVRRRKGAPILMYLALASAAVAGFFAVVHFFPHGDATNPGTAPPRGSDVVPGIGSAGSAGGPAGSADAVAVATGSAGSAGSADTAIDVDTPGSDATAAHPTGPVEPTTKPGATKPGATKPGATKPTTTKPGTARPDTTKPATTKPETTKPETTKPETTKPETTKPAIVAEDGCDEVSCVLEKYQRACCERFKPAETGFHPKNEVPDSLDKSMVKAGIEKVKPKVIACGEKSAAKGTVKLAITVGPEGNISDISVSASPDQALGDCVLAAVKRASFGKSVNGASFTYPFAF